MYSLQNIISIKRKIKKQKTIRIGPVRASVRTWARDPSEIETTIQHNSNKFNKLTKAEINFTQVAIDMSTRCRQMKFGDDLTIDTSGGADVQMSR